MHEICIIKREFIHWCAQVKYPWVRIQTRISDIHRFLRKSESIEGGCSPSRKCTRNPSTSPEKWRKNWKWCVYGLTLFYLLCFVFLLFLLVPFAVIYLKYILVFRLSGCLICFTLTIIVSGLQDKKTL